MTWKDILAEEPFTGQHWQGAYGLPPDSVVKTWDDSGSESEFTPPLSPASHAQFTTHDDSISLKSDTTSDSLETAAKEDDGEVFVDNIERSLQLRFQLEELQRRQYWRNSWQTDANPSRAFSIANPSTLSESVHHHAILLCTYLPVFRPIISSSDCWLNFMYWQRGESKISPSTDSSLIFWSTQKFINEHDAVREILIALQGRDNLLLATRDDTVESVVASSPPMLLHLSPDSQTSIIGSFARIGTALLRLRLFLRVAQQVETYFQPSAHKTRPSRTLEAFSDAVDKQLRIFERWCSTREERILTTNGQSTVVVSLLSLERAIREGFSELFTELLHILHQLSPDRRLSSNDDFERLCQQSSTSSSYFAAQLLDTMSQSIHSRNSFGDTITAASLVEVFKCTVAPLWRMIHRWLGDPTIVAGATWKDFERLSVLPDEFFIEHSGLTVEDPAFWSKGFTQREHSEGVTCVPGVFQGVVEDVLAAGKSFGLLQLLRKSHGIRQTQQNPWIQFEELMSESLGRRQSYSLQNANANADSQQHIHSPEHLTLLVDEYLKPRCTAVRKMLTDMVFRDCGFWEELRAIEGFLLMQIGDVTSNLSDMIFARVRGDPNHCFVTDVHSCLDGRQCGLDRFPLPKQCCNRSRG